MINSDLIQTLRSLTSTELLVFREKLSVSKSKTAKDAFSLLEALQKSAPDYDDPKVISKKSIFGKLFPGRSYNEQRIRDLMSNLFGHLKRHLVEMELQVSPDMQSILLLRQMRKRRLSKVYNKQSSKYRSTLEKSSIKDDAYYGYQLQLLEEAEHFQEQQDVRQVEIASHEQDFMLDVQYLIKKLRISCALRNYQDVFGTAYPFRLVEELVPLVNQKYPVLLEEPAVRVYLNVWQTLTKPASNEHFEQFLAQLRNDIQYFSRKEGRDLYRYAQNHCIKQINQGSTAHLEKLFSIYQELLDTELILENSVLSHTDYKNMVTVALRLKQFNWTKEFIESYKSKLHRQHRENAYNYNLAVYYHENQDYKEAIKLLNTIEFTDDVYYTLSAKYILVRIYFEQEDFEALQYLMNATTLFVKRSRELSVENRQGMLNFIAILRKIIRLIEAMPYERQAILKERFQKIKLQLDQKKSISNIGWLKEKLAEIEREIR